MAQIKNLSQLAKAYAEGRIPKKNKLTITDGVGRVSCVPVDKTSKKAIAGAAPEVVYESPVEQLLKDAMKLAGVPVA